MKTASKGLGVEQNYELARSWFEKAACENYPLAQHSLGNIYLLGRGVEQDYLEALRWYTFSAEQGLSMSQYEIAVMYANGEGVEKNYELARHWYERAAYQGYTNAQYALGNMYSNGDLAINNKEAIYWLCLASRAGNEEAKELLHEVAKRLSLESLEAIVKRVNQYKPMPTQTTSKFLDN